MSIRSSLLIVLFKASAGYTCHQGQRQWELTRVSVHPCELQLVLRPLFFQSFFSISFWLCLLLLCLQVNWSAVSNLLLFPSNVFFISFFCFSSRSFIWDFFLYLPCFCLTCSYMLPFTFLNIWNVVKIILMSLSINYIICVTSGSVVYWLIFLLIIVYILCFFAWLIIFYWMPYFVSCWMLDIF